MLKGEDKEGCFVVRNSSTKGLYTLSLFTKIPHPQVSKGGKFIHPSLKKIQILVPVAHLTRFFSILLIN